MPKKKEISLRGQRPSSLIRNLLPPRWAVAISITESPARRSHLRCGATHGLRSYQRVILGSGAIDRSLEPAAGRDL